MPPPRTFRHRLSALYELQPGGDDRLLSMEGLRGLAMAMVFLVHYTTLAAPWLAEAGPVSRMAAKAILHIGPAGVDLFFAISGYLIYGSLIARPQPFGRYLARRLQRIYPVFLAVLALYLALSFAVPERSKLPEAPWAAVVYIVQNLLLLPGMLDIKPIITVAWSLSYELFFYLTLPLLVFALRLRALPGRARVAVCLLLCLAIVIWFSARVHVVMFIAGMLVFEAVRAGRPLPLWLDRLALILLPVLALVILTARTVTDLPAPFHTLAEHRPLIYMAALFAGCFLTGVAAFGVNGVLARAVAVTPLRWLGNISYSFYLIHGLALHAVIMAAALIVPPEGQAPHVFWLLLGPAFAAAWAAATVLFALVERPFSLDTTLAGRRAARPAARLRQPAQ